MGGFGSGGHNRTGRSTTAEARSIDVNRLNREGCLVPGWRGTWQWSRDGQQVALIGLEAADGDVTLTYRWRRGEDPWQDIRERVSITWRPCRFGGRRPYFTCPGVVNGRTCGRSTVKLYGASVYFLCRCCYRLTYPSQRERELDRMIRRCDRVRQKLGGPQGILNSFPSKPKGMHNRTYERYFDEAGKAEMAAEESMMEKVCRFDGKIARAKTGQRGAVGKEFWS